MKDQPNQPQAAPRQGNGNQRQGRLPEQTQEAAERAREAAIEKVEHVRDRARESIDQGKQQVADRIRRLSSALRSASDTLREDDQVVARYADYASETMERAAGYIGSSDVRRALRDVEGFARQQPALFFGGAFLLGLAAGRFLKSSQRRNGEHEEFESIDSSDRITATDWPTSSRQRSVPSPQSEGVFDVDQRIGAAGAPPGVFGQPLGTPPTGREPLAGPQREPLGGSARPSPSGVPDIPSPDDLGNRRRGST